MMLSFVAPYWTAVFLARIVMPRSRSWSIESMTRSVSAAPSRKAPDWRSIASTSVVLPWSTWAMMATLRRSSRVAEKVGLTAGIRRNRLGDRLQEDTAASLFSRARRWKKDAKAPATDVMTTIA